MHVAKAKSRAVTHEAAQKYDVKNIKNAVIYFENVFSTLNSQRVMYIIKRYQCILEMNYMGLYLTAFKNGNTYLRWIIKVMNVMGISVLINVTKGGCIKCNNFFISEGNKINFIHIIVDYMDKQHVES